MLLTHWLRNLAHMLQRRATRRYSSPARRRLPNCRGIHEVEILEDRSLLSVITVDVATDELDGNINDGDVSLRDAIAAANAGDTITFNPAQMGSSTIILTLGQLTIDKSLTIDGESNGITIDAQGNSRIFTIDDGNFTPDQTVSLSGLTITGGNDDFGAGISNRENLSVTDSTVTGNSATGDGGGIFNRGTLDLSQSNVSGNSAYYGGGLSNSSTGTATVSSSTFSNNLGQRSGGGIDNRSVGGTLTLNDSTLSGNTSNAGAGLFNEINATTTIRNSRFSDNYTSGGGGGIFNNGTATVANSTISGNTGGYGGAGIHNIRNLTLTNSTLTLNYSPYKGGGFLNSGTATVTNSTVVNNTGYYGGGIYNEGGTTTVRNSIITGNISDNGPDVRGSFMSNAHNVIGNTSSSSGFGGTDDIGTNPADVIELTLANNGGLTLTLALVDSPTNP
ncbi:MAG: hypothetical protein KDA84_10255, partial [Planctomycetaceae bacterium]|nr:hypothetical protein [Planctomycetaceae bacterium]